MKILFTRGSSPLSNEICKMTGEDVSHCVLQVGYFIIHSNLLGLHIDWAPNFLRKNTVKYVLEKESDSDKSRLDKLLEEYEHKMYDVGALMFLWLTFVLRAKLSLPLPKSNLWQTTGMFLCTEWISKYADGKEDSMITPYKLYLRLKESGDWKETL